MLALLKKFCVEEEGVTAIEYGLIAALIAIVIVTAVFNSGQSLKVLWEKIDLCLKAATTGAGC
jgi:pilus assembly protein Flp/PilA